MEDQSINGGIWNKQLSKLLNLLGWETVGDHEIDIKGSDGEKYGIDTLMTYETPLKNMPQSVIVEAKRYLTTSFNASLLQKWVDRIDDKLVALRNSSDVVELFPTLSDCTQFDVGLIAIWFHNVNDYKEFQPSFKTALQNVSISGRERKIGKNIIYVIDNTRIMRMCALYDVMKTWNNFSFYYDPEFTGGKPAEEKKVLTPEYMFSDIILGINKKESIVFYFGTVDDPHIRMLKAALKKTTLWVANKPLTIYLYHTDIDVRKNKNSFKEIFNEMKVTFKSMTELLDLPGYLKEIEYE